MKFLPSRLSHAISSFLRGSPSHYMKKLSSTLALAFTSPSTALSTLLLGVSSTTCYVIHSKHSSTYCDPSTSPSIVNELFLLRKEYSSRGISDEDIASNPIKFFATWLEEARNAKVIEPNAMCLSTSVNNIPSGRMVLLKAFDDQGFVFFTNYDSRKGDELHQNNNAALTFWWGELERQVRIEGKVEKVSSELSDEYFSVRPRDAKIGAWSSDQSREIPSRKELETKEWLFKLQFDGQADIPRPAHWGGYRLVPTRIEFWKGRESRLHDRVVYKKASNGDWIITRLQP